MARSSSTFAAGQGGNPKGRPKYAEEVKRLAQEQSAPAIATLTALLRHRDGKVRIAAAKELLDRGVGRAPMAITGGDGGPIRLSGDPEVLALLERLAAGEDK